MQSLAAILVGASAWHWRSAMNPVTRDELIRQIHDRPLRIVLAVTGGGSGAIYALLQVPGASRTVLEAVVPYAAPALVDWLGAVPEQFCSARTARAMAMAGFQRAVKFAGPDAAAEHLAGISCTASLASDRPKRGAHRAHLAVQTCSYTWTRSVTLNAEAGTASGTRKNANAARGGSAPADYRRISLRSRRDEEELIAGLLLNILAEAAGLASRVELPLTQSERVEAVATTAPPPWRDLLLGKTEAVSLGETPPARTAKRHTPRRRAIFPGAFNPVHEGHRQMAALAARRLRVPVEFEISIVNVDKPPLDFTEMEQRARQFTGQTLWFTRAATFVEKSRLFAGATFVVGTDTITRIADPKYYNHDRAACRRALRTIVRQGCRFLVFSRAADGRVHRLRDLSLPAELAAICDEVPPKTFRLDVSSTELRQKAEQSQAAV
jgi:nicotinic acid mononucleotide adenylyltransferase/nicotinamide mononucleotide (NMN) deamidase PncC